METFLQKRNIKPVVVIVLSSILFFLGTATTPPSEETNSNLNHTSQSTIEANKDKNGNSTKPDNSTSNNTTKPNNSSSNNTTNPDSSSSNQEKNQMVWVSSSGNKYHSKSTCSGMKSPRQISLDDAKKQGYTACKNCS